MKDFDVTKDNCIAIAQWLLLCYPDDFRGALDQVADLYDAVDQAYHQQHSNPLNNLQGEDTPSLPFIKATRLLYEKLTPASKYALRKNSQTFHTQEKIKEELQEDLVTTREDVE